MSEVESSDCQQGGVSSKSDCQQHGVRSQNIYSAATWSQNMEQLIVSNMDSETGTSDCQLHGI